MKIYLVFLFYVFFSFQVFAEPFRDGELKLLKFDISSKAKMGKIFNLNFPFFNYKNNLYIIIAAPLGVAMGDYVLKISSENEKISEQVISVQTRVNIKTEEVIETSEDSVLPKDGNVVERVAREDVELKNIFKNISPMKHWDNKFILPVNKKFKTYMNSAFGLYRVYSNHIRRRTHWGVDYRVSIGTKVYASAAGIVVWASELYFPGRTIIIDHGLGLFTGYSHLKLMNVKVGDTVKIGQSIGKSGNSGKTSGPHLHWFAVNGRVKVDPLTLLNIKF